MKKVFSEMTENIAYGNTWLGNTVIKFSLLNKDIEIKVTWI